MKQVALTENKKELQALCSKVRELVQCGEFEQCEHLLRDAMSKYPHDAEPHNLYGILLEKQRDHVAAMKHFRAAWDLNPTHLPARYNLEWFGTFYSTGKCAYDETDCPTPQNESKYKLVYDDHGIGRFIRREKDESING